MADQVRPEAKSPLEARKARIKDFVGNIHARVPSVRALSVEAGFSTSFKPQVRAEVQQAFASIETMRTKIQELTVGMEEEELGALGIPMMEAAYLALKADLISRGHIVEEKKKPAAE
jgi:hypothetical protein